MAKKLSRTASAALDGGWEWCASPPIFVLRVFVRIRFLGEHRGGPFFCYVPFDAPHDPHIVPGDFPVHYDPDKIGLMGISWGGTIVSTVAGVDIAARSAHPGGVNSALGDGSVHWISNYIDVQLWRAICTSRGSEIMPMPE